MLFSGAWREDDPCKKPEAKNPWQCPFKWIVNTEILTYSFGLFYKVVEKLRRLVIAVVISNFLQYLRVQKITRK